MKIPIFYYHSIGSPPPETVPLVHFQQHLDWIERLGFTTLTFSELLRTPSTQLSDKRYCVLTFDDGLLDNFEMALPELLKRKMKATFFVVPGYDTVTRWVNPSTRKWSDTVRDGYTIPFQNMTSSHRRELVKLGMEIGSHTVTHRKLTRIDPAEWQREIVDSKRVLEDELSIPIHTFCYPLGGVNSAIADIVKTAGYLGATTTMPGYYSARGNPFRVNRFLIERPDFFKSVLKGRAFWPQEYLKARFFPS